MSTSTLGMPDDIREYMLSVSVRETLILKNLREETALMENSIMQISPEQGQLMYMLIRLINAKKTLEIGVFTGYSTLWTAMGLPEDGLIIACDVNREWTDIAEKYWIKASVDHKIDLRIAPAEDTLNSLIEAGLGNTFDFAFIDANKEDYGTYFEQCMQLIKPGGLIALDNVLRHGSVIDPQSDDPGTVAIRELNRRIYVDDRVDVSMIPVSDGLTLVRREA
ncbi:MAG: class I SAM-dependent methyltransferase [Candidatus Fermentibacteraceae bacterium]|nr:class I SAM-dependent methyltransferase [Candidatus Fermentibacteraceae bacterium]